MAKVRLIFYKAQFDSWSDLIISVWTGLWNIGSPPYSHVEIGFKIYDKWKYFSSSLRDGGTRWKEEQEILKHPERWDVYEKEYAEEAVNRMISRAYDLKGKKYDWLGILGFATLTGLFVNKADWWYCSEAVWKVLTDIWIKRISPRAFWRRIDGMFEKVELTNNKEDV